MEAQPVVVDHSLHSIVQRFVIQHTVSPASGCVCRSVHLFRVKS